MYQSGKLFKNVASVCFRQWRATHSHCSRGHGYALSFSYTFESQTLDDKNWIFDFGGLKDLKKDLENRFDHKTLAASDDPHLSWYIKGNQLGVIDLVVVPNLSCECFAKIGFDLAHEHFTKIGQRVRITNCTVWEHESNWATYINPELDISMKEPKLSFYMKD